MMIVRQALNREPLAVTRRPRRPRRALMVWMIDIPGEYGDAHADVCDRIYGARFEPQDAVAALAAAAGPAGCSNWESEPDG
jgi:hypothetical protein